MMLQNKGIGRIFIFVFIVSFVFISCSKEGVHKFTTSINEDGVEVCVNSDGPKYTEPLYEIEETLSLGGEEPEPKLFQPQDFLVDDDGFLYFTDEDRIKKFEADGKFVSFIAARGEGPGEVNYPTLHRFIGDTLVVDQYQRIGGKLFRFDLFLREGSFVQRVMIPKSQEKLIEDGLNYIEQYYCSNKVIFSSSKYWEQGDAQFSMQAFGIANTHGVTIKQLEIPLESKQTRIIKEEKDFTITTGRPYTILSCQIDVGQYLYFLMPSGKEIRVFTLDGELNRIIELDLPEPPVTHEDINRLIERRSRPGRPAVIKSNHFPSVKPVVCENIVDDRGWLWLKKGEDFHSSGKEPNTYLIIDEKGEYVADQILPMKLSAVSNNHAYGFTMTEDDLKIFKRYQLNRRVK